jgi:integrase
VLNAFFRLIQKQSANEVTVDDVRKFLIENQNKKTNTYCVYVAILKMFFLRTNLPVFEWMHRTVNAKLVEVETIPLTKEQLYALAEDFKAHARPKWLADVWECFHWFIAACGSRIGETIALNMENLSFEDGLYKIKFRAETTKTGQKREPFIARNSYAGALLFNYLRKYRANAKPEDPVFIGRDGGRLHCNRAEIKYQEAKKRLGIKSRCTPHVLRHTYVKFLRKRKVPPEDIHKITGHSIAVLLSTYSYSDEKDRKDVARKHQIG